MGYDKKGNFVLNSVLEQGTLTSHITRRTIDGKKVPTVTLESTSDKTNSCLKITVILTEKQVIEMKQKNFGKGSVARVVGLLRTTNSGKVVIVADYIGGVGFLINKKFASE